MRKFKLSINALERLYRSEVQVELMEGVYYRASISAEFKTYKLQLSVSKIHPILSGYAIIPENPELVLWENGKGKEQSSSYLLNGLINSLNFHCSMKDEEAIQILKKFNLISKSL